MNKMSDKMFLNLCLVILSVLITVSAKISNEGDNTGIETPNLTGCQCINNDCGCCQHLKVKSVHLDDTMCTNITYLPDDYGFTLTVTFDSLTLFNTTLSEYVINLGGSSIKRAFRACERTYNFIINTPTDIHMNSTDINRMQNIIQNLPSYARNPPPICIGQDYVKELEAEICIRFYNLDVNKHHLHGCLKFVVELYKIKLASYDLGCFDVGPKSLENNENIIKTKLRTFFSRNQVPQVTMV